MIVRAAAPLQFTLDMTTTTTKTTTMRSVSVIALATASAMAACSLQTNSIDDDDELAHTTQNAGGGATTQDWSLLGGGQCLVAMQNFYPKKFGVKVPSARGSATGDCLGEGACHIWLDDIPSSADWQRIPNDGKQSPSAYDLIVFPPTATNGYGHIASVDHVDADGTIWVMDSNYNLDEKKSNSPHTVRSPYGWYHLRSLVAGGGGSSSGGSTTPNTTANTCGNYAKKNGLKDARCEWNGNNACKGVGAKTDDCSHCCDAANPAPTQTRLTCGQLAQQQKWGSAAKCEWNGNKACGGKGVPTRDCTFCCAN